jgi:hypothetical protein
MNFILVILIIWLCYAVVFKYEPDETTDLTLPKL